MSYELKIFNDILFALGSICGVLGLFFAWRNGRQSVKDRKQSKKWYSRAWKTVNKSGIKELPERVVKWVIWKKGEYLKKLSNFYGGFIEKVLPSDKSNPGLVGQIFIITLLLAPAAFLFIQITGNLWIAILLAAFFMMLVLLLANALENPRIKIFVGLILILSSGLGIYYLLVFTTGLNSFLCALLFFILTPLLGFIFVLIFWNLINMVGESDSASNLLFLIPFSFAASISFGITATALLIGTLIAPNSHLPQNPQMLLVNVFFDALTLGITFSLLKWSIQKIPSLRIPLVIAADFAIAAMLACLSLYFGLLGSDYSLTTPETVNVLIALSPDGSKLELSPYFWAMHTTFIPTLLYLAVIIFVIIGKYFTLPVLGLLKQGGNAEKPHLATATTFAFIAGFLLGVVKIIEKFAQ